MILRLKEHKLDQGYKFLKKERKTQNLFVNLEKSRQLNKTQNWIIESLRLKIAILVLEVLETYSHAKNFKCNMLTIFLKTLYR